MDGQESPNQENSAIRTSVSVVVPCYNEEKTIAGLLDAVLRQTLRTEHLEVVIADGGSTDGTLQVIEAFIREHPDLRVKVIENPGRSIPQALNRAIAHSTGDIVVRLDAHSVPERDYVEKCVRTLQQTRSANAGGVWLIRPSAETWMGRAIAVAAAHPLAAGDARYRIGGVPGEVDTVPFGAFRRSWLEKVGPFNEDLLTNEDYEYNVRIRRAGGKVWFDPEIRSIYYARPNLPSLARQYLRYGFWKAKMIRLFPGSLRWRQILPPVLLFGLLTLLVLSAFCNPAAVLVAGALSLYAVALLLVALIQAISRSDLHLLAGFPAAVATMHLCWAAGFWLGLIPTMRWNKVLR